MAEQEWYEKHKKDVAAALKKGRGAAPDGGVSCTLVRMKDGSALLCAHVSTSKAAALVKEAKAVGGKVLSSGTLYKGDGGPTFAVSDGSTSVKALFSSAAAEALGSPLKVDVVAATVPADGAVPPLPPVASPPTADGDKARFTDLLGQLRPRFQQAVAADPPNKAALEKGMSLAVAAAKENDFGKGLKVLQALDSALQRTPIAAVPPAPPPPPPAPPGSPPPATAAIQAALTKMIPLVKGAAAANTDRKAELLEPLKRCQDHLKNNEAAGAKAALFDLNRALKDLNGAAPPPPPPGPTPDALATPAEDAAEFKTRLKEVLPLYKEAAEKAPDRKDELARLATQASAAGQAKKFAEAVDLLDQLEARSRSALRAAQAKREIGADKGANVLFKKCRLTYVGARARAEAGIAKLKARILGDRVLRTLPQFPQIQRAVAQLDGLLAPLDDRLTKALDACITAAPDDRPKAREKALAVLNDYRKDVEADPLIRELDAGTGYGAFPIHKPLVAALNTIADQLQA